MMLLVDLICAAAAPVAILFSPGPPPPLPPLFSAREVAAKGISESARSVWEPSVAAIPDWALSLFNVGDRSTPRTGYSLYDRASGEWVSEGTMLLGSGVPASIDSVQHRTRLAHLLLQRWVEAKY